MLWQVTFTGPLFFFFNHRKGNKSALRCWRSEGKGKKDETCAFFFCVCVRICYSTSVACQKWQSVCCGCTEKRGDGAVDAGSRATEGRVRSFFFFLLLIPFLNICASIPFCRCYIRLLMAFVFRLSTASCGFFFIFVSGGRQQGESGLYSE